MASINLGTVAAVPCGAYEDGVAYKKLNIVIYSSSSYMAREAVTGVRPGTSDIWCCWRSAVRTGRRGRRGSRGRSARLESRECRASRGVQGERGIQGEKGETGERGPQGIQGIQGERGIQGLTGETGPRGPVGETGQSMMPMGRYETLEEMKAAQPEPEAGACYEVGASAPYDIYIYVYDDAAGGLDWVNQGRIQGPQGEPGDPASLPVRATVAEMEAGTQTEARTMSPAEVRTAAAVAAEAAEGKVSRSGDTITGPIAFGAGGGLRLPLPGAMGEAGAIGYGDGASATSGLSVYGGKGACRGERLVYDEVNTPAGTQSLAEAGTQTE